MNSAGPSSASSSWHSGRGGGGADAAWRSRLRRMQLRIVCLAPYRLRKAFFADRRPAAGRTAGRPGSSTWPSPCPAWPRARRAAPAARRPGSLRWRTWISPRPIGIAARCATPKVRRLDDRRATGRLDLPPAVAGNFAMRSRIPAPRPRAAAGSRAAPGCSPRPRWWSRCATTSPTASREGAQADGRDRPLLQGPPSNLSDRERKELRALSARSSRASWPRRSRPARLRRPLQAPR